jgi:hypothetical protein
VSENSLLAFSFAFYVRILTHMQQDKNITVSETAVHFSVTLCILLDNWSNKQRSKQTGSKHRIETMLLNFFHAVAHHNETRDFEVVQMILKNCLFSSFSLFYFLRPFCGSFLFPTSCYKQWFYLHVYLWNCTVLNLQLQTTQGNLHEDYAFP